MNLEQYIRHLEAMGFSDFTARVFTDAENRKWLLINPAGVVDGVSATFRIEGNLLVTSTYK